MAAENVTRYIARVWENDDITHIDDYELAPRLALIAITTFVVWAWGWIPEYCVEQILLRSFPHPAEKLCLIKGGEKTTPLAWYFTRSRGSAWVAAILARSHVWLCLDVDFWPLVRDGFLT